MKFAISYNIDLQGTALVVFADVPYADAPTPRDAERSWRVPGAALVTGEFSAPPQAHDGGPVPLGVVEAAVARAREDHANAVQHPVRRMRPVREIDDGGGDEEADDGLLDLLHNEVRDVLGELAKVARALSSAPDDTEARARVCPRSADRHPWQIGTLEQICRNQAAEVRVLVRRLQRAMGIPSSGVDSADPTASSVDAPYAHDDRD